MTDAPLINARELADLLRGRQADARVLLDVRWTLAGSDHDGYLAAHIPGAVFVDLDHELAAPPGLGGRHPLPDPADLQAVWRAAGIDDDSSVVVYDGGSGLASARAWWLLRWSGLRDVRVLDGGLAAWSAMAGRRTVAGSERADDLGTVTVRPGSMPVVEVDRATELAESGALIDARAAARYRGEIEPLDPVAGHIPGSLNLPIGDLLAADGTFRSATELRAAFAALGVLAGRKNAVAASCGSGITACQLILAAEVAGLELALYPGSYSQWCALGRPVAVGS
jgi:thiosulfate/3-mercaptopyruvate sulfurtransferase